MTSLLNTCRWFPAGIHKLDNNRRVYINAFELLHVITEYIRAGPRDVVAGGTGS